MKAIHYAPIIGMPIALNHILQSDSDFTTKCYQAAFVGATQAGLVAVGMNTNYLTARKAQAIVQIGLRAPGFTSTAVTVATPAMAAYVIADPIHKAHHKLAPGNEGSRSDNKSFWSSVAQAMTGGFGTGGWQPY